MKHLILLGHIIFQLTWADTNEEPSQIPCPFASSAFADWSDAPHDLFALDERSDDIDGVIDFLGGRQLGAVIEIEQAVLKGQHDFHSDQSTRTLKRKRNKTSTRRKKSNTEHANTSRQDSGLIKGGESSLRGRNKKTSNTKNNSNKRQKKKTGKRNKKKTKRGKNKTSKHGKRGSGLGSTSPSRCFSNVTYDSIDDDIAKLKKVIKDGETRSHFLGGIVRLAAHDFMDFDKRDRSNPMGSDGCFDEMHPTNKGLPESVWCKNCLLRRLYEERYSDLSRADFWIAAANAVIRQTSEKNSLDLRNTFRWGRKDKHTCRQSASRLPEATGCKDVESAFLTRMGLDWKDAVALMGAHSLGRGSADFSGHEGTWVDTAVDAQIFDKQYFEEIVFNAWRPRNVGLDTQDFTTGNNKRNQRMMLNTDICLVFDIDKDVQCCTKTDEFFQGGQTKCIDSSLKQCPLYPKGHERWEATQAVVDYIGGTKGSKSNNNFYTAFAVAWEKATTNGWKDLKELSGDCESTS